jgi:tetratricopeptide (TPR) repeat protein
MISVVYGIASMTKRTAQQLVSFTILLVFAVLQGPVAAEDYLDYYEQGEFALRVQKWDRAIELFTKSIQDNPNFFVAYHNRAIAYSKKGEYDKSIQDLKKAVQLNPDYPDAYGLMGLVYEIKKDYPAALQIYQEALAREKRPAAQKTLRNFVQDLEAKVKKK